MMVITIQPWIILNRKLIRRRLNKLKKRARKSSKKSIRFRNKNKRNKSKEKEKKRKGSSLKYQEKYPSNTQTKSMIFLTEL